MGFSHRGGVEGISPRWHRRILKMPSWGSHTRLWNFLRRRSGCPQKMTAWTPSLRRRSQAKPRPNHGLYFFFTSVLVKSWLFVVWKFLTEQLRNQVSLHCLQDTAFASDLFWSRWLSDGISGRLFSGAMPRNEETQILLAWMLGFLGAWRCLA